VCVAVEKDERRDKRVADLKAEITSTGAPFDGKMLRLFLI
jgi:hypothetical protein